MAARGTPARAPPPALALAAVLAALAAVPARARGLHAPFNASEHAPFLATGPGCGDLCVGGQHRFYRVRLNGSGTLDVDVIGLPGTGPVTLIHYDGDPPPTPVPVLESVCANGTVPPQDCQRYREWLTGGPGKNVTRVCGYNGGQPRCWGVRSNGSVVDLGPGDHFAPRALGGGGGEGKALLVNSSLFTTHNPNRGNAPQRARRRDPGGLGLRWYPHCDKSTPPGLIALGANTSGLVHLPDPDGGSGRVYFFFTAGPGGTGGCGGVRGPCLGSVCAGDCTVDGQSHSRWPTWSHAGLRCTGDDGDPLLDVADPAPGPGGQPTLFALFGSGGNVSVCAYPGDDLRRHFGNTSRVGASGGTPAPPLGRCPDGNTPGDKARLGEAHPRLTDDVAPWGGGPLFTATGPHSHLVAGAGGDNTTVLVLGGPGGPLLLARLEPNGTLSGPPQPLPRSLPHQPLLALALGAGGNGVFGATNGSVLYVPFGAGDAPTPAPM
ncbi:putative inhibitor of apoptosis [Equine molluscum contagiosum-like virus]|nr:hypothetical protein EMCLV001L [Equine molluscum contagiosum-like virus]QGN68157.1 putative inhibitor of apoptosis [Equine molluscum contagiosum-like virus]